MPSTTGTRPMRAHYFPHGTSPAGAFNGSTVPSSRDTSRTAMSCFAVRCDVSRFATAADCFCPLSRRRHDLDYREGWPRVENLAAQAEFRNQGMYVRSRAPDVGDVKVDSAQARFADFNSGRARGPCGRARRRRRRRALPAPRRRSMPWRIMRSRASRRKGPMQTTVDLFCRSRTSSSGECWSTDIWTERRSTDGRDAGRTGLTGNFDIDGAQVARADIRGRALGGPLQMQARAPRSSRHADTHPTGFSRHRDGRCLARGDVAALQHLDRRTDRVARGARNGARAGTRADVALQQSASWASR